MKANKRDWLHFITGAVAAVIVSAAVVDAANVTPVPEPIRKCCCCCCCKVNTDEVVYTLEVEANHKPSLSANPLLTQLYYHDERPT